MAKKGEYDRLLTDKNFIRAKTAYRTKLNKLMMYLLISVVAILVLIFLIVAAVIVHRRVRTKHSFNATGGIPGKKKEAEARVLDLSEVRYKDFSKFLIQNATIEEASEVDSDSEESFSRIYIVKGEKNLTDEQACGIESILRLFPDKTIYVIDFNKNENQKYDRCSGKPNYLALLLLLYRERLQLVLADKKQFFKDTPLHNVTKNSNETAFYAMLLTAYKYGGFVASPDVVMTDRYFVQCMPDRTVVEPYAIITPQKNDSYLNYLVQTVSVCGTLNSSLDSIISQSLDIYNKAEVQPAKNSPKRLGPSEICTTVKMPCPFLKLEAFKDDLKWILDLSPYCKQVVQAYLGIKINKMEVEEETWKIKDKIRSQAHKCDRHQKGKFMRVDSESYIVF